MSNETRHFPLLAVHIQYVPHVHPGMQSQSPSSGQPLTPYDVSRLRRTGENLYNRFGAFDAIFYPPRYAERVVEHIIHAYNPREKKACQVIEKEALIIHKGRENILRDSARIKAFAEEISPQWTGKRICIVSNPDVAFGLREAWRFPSDIYSHTKSTTRVTEGDSLTIFEFHRDPETPLKKQPCGYSYPH